MSPTLLVGMSKPTFSYDSVTAVICSAKAFFFGF